MRDLEARPIVLDTSRLKSGMVVKGYKGMCEILGVKPYDKSRNGRALQEEDWRRYFEWEEVGHGYLRRITNIKKYPDSVPPPPNAVYVKLIEMMLVYKLSKEEAPEIEKTWGDLFEFLGMVNERFKDHRTYVAYDHIDKEIRHISDIGYKDWGVRARGGFKRKLRTALNSMQRRQLIIWDEVLYCVIVNEEEYVDKRTGRGKRSEIHVKAGSNEKAVKTEAHRYVLQEIYHLDDEDQIIANGWYQDYIDEVNEYLYHHYKILRFYTKVRISYRYTTVGKAIEDTKKNLEAMAEEFDFEVKWDELTETLIDMLNSEASGKHMNAHKRIMDVGNSNEDDESISDMIMRYVYFESDDYLLEQELFSQYFISRHSTVESLKEKYGKSEEEKREDELSLLMEKAIN